MELKQQNNFIIIFVFSKDRLVIEVRVDTYTGKSVSYGAEYSMPSKILAAKTGNAVEQPNLRPVPGIVQPPEIVFNGPLARKIPWKVPV